jgi:hypothetical protein
MGDGLDDQPTQPTADQEVAQGGGHQDSERIPNGLGDASVLAGLPPFEPQVLRCREMYLLRLDRPCSIDGALDSIRGRARLG